MFIFDPNDAHDKASGGEEEPQFEAPIASPSVLGEQDVFSGDATTSESPDIDEELAKVGLQGDEEGVKPLGSDENIK